MQPYQNPYESPQSQLVNNPTTMPVAGTIEGTPDQRMAFPEHTTVELRRWKQHYNSLILFTIGLVITMLSCFGAGVALSTRSTPEHTVYAAAAIFLLALGIASLIGVMNRSAWTPPLIWAWIVLWSLMSIGGAVTAFTFGNSEVALAILQLLVYVVVLIIFVGKALGESNRIFGPERINENQLKEELAYREMNSIP
jgi:hypothetical protein